ncbi:dTMP kinase [Enterococcus rotai]|uniref:Thymidylate kinase-like domain-containing protein n=1 Tax=Enterococcus rotai TaxID=118060 RepID=A0A0U2X7C6_9ENTE|nr:deoxynucleoside kinase [Enterococcus rotai]ALS36064.1 hypothetical protein ATZ35_02475 [Enterococcus rotai]
MSITIGIEGNDGAGKSSVIKLLKKYYISKGYKVLVVRFNMSYITLPAIKEGKKRLYSCEVNSLLHYLSIKDQYERYVSKFKKRKYIIIWDRYIYSVCSRGVVRGMGTTLLSFILKSTPPLDIIIYLDIDPNLALKRLNGNVNFWESGLDIYLNKKKEIAFIKFQKNVREESLKLFSEVNSCYVIDADEEKTILLKKIVKIIDNKVKHPYRR